MYLALHSSHIRHIVHPSIHPSNPPTPCPPRSLTQTTLNHHRSDTQTTYLFLPAPLFLGRRRTFSFSFSSPVPDRRPSVSPPCLSTSRYDRYLPPRNIPSSVHRLSLVRCHLARHRQTLHLSRPTGRPGQGLDLERLETAGHTKERERGENMVPSTGRQRHG